MPRRSLSVTVSMPTEMDEQIAKEAEKHGLNYSQYVRACIRDNVDTPFDESEVDLTVDDSDAAEAQTGAA